jgi:hypothetical protein
MSEKVGVPFTTISENVEVPVKVGEEIGEYILAATLFAKYTSEASDVSNLLFNKTCKV